MLDSFLAWVFENRMPLLVGLILVWSGLVRVAMGPLAGARMALFGAPPVVLVTWAWLLDLTLLNLLDFQVATWWCVAIGFAVGTLMDLARAQAQQAVLFAMTAAGAIVLILGAVRLGGPDLSPTPLGIVQAWSGHWLMFAALIIVAFVVIVRNRQGARGASIARYISHFLFALGAAYIMRMQGFADSMVLAVGLMAVHLVFPALLGAVEAGWLSPREESGETRRPSFPGWSGTLGLLLPLYLWFWLHVSAAQPLGPDQVGLRAAVLLSLLLVADLVIRPSRAFGLQDIRRDVAFGARSLYLVTACALLLLAIFVQRIQNDVAAGIVN